MPNFNVSKIVVIDSLKEREFQTGAEIEKVIRYEFSEHNLPLAVERYSITTAAEFAPIIRQLIAAADVETPLLHIEMHGDQFDGLFFQDDSFLTWEQVSAALLPLNQATGFNLACVFAACYGAYFTNVLYVTQASPCFALIGPQDEVDPGEVHRAFRTLYHNFAVKQDMGVAASMLAEQVPIKGGWFHLTMDRWLYGVLQAFVREEASALAVTKRAQSILNQINSPLTFGLTPADIEVKSFAQTSNRNIWTLADMKMLVMLKTHQYVSNLAFERFFMIASIPENEERFSVVKEALMTEVVPYIGR